MKKRIIEELKNVPKLGLSDLLKKRKITLKKFVDEFGITTYEALQIRCQRIGVKPPIREDFLKIFPNEATVSNPQEGVIVVEAPPVISESTGTVIENISDNENTNIDSGPDIENLNQDVKPDNQVLENSAESETFDKIEQVVATHYHNNKKRKNKKQ